jgi:hypothetical protein
VKADSYCESERNSPLPGPNPSNIVTGVGYPRTFLSRVRASPGTGAFSALEGVDGASEADDLDAAIELASKIPAARMGGSVEVRPLKEQ